tara:strand:+ start:711 stop:968 length:258 start_codon:yes stop_codon:yes gene_type:complete
MIKEQTLPKWFNGELYKKGGNVRNRFSGEQYELNNVELSMYDFVMGAVQLMEMGILNTPHHAQMVRKGTDWFRKNNAEAYMVLLD